MKILKVLGIIFGLLIMVSVANAEIMPINTFIEISDSDQYDIDGDGVDETIRYSVASEGEDARFADIEISVNGASYMIESAFFENDIDMPRLYAVRFDDTSIFNECTFLLRRYSEDMFIDYDVLVCYYDWEHEEWRIQYLDTLETDSNIESLRVEGPNSFSVYERCFVVCSPWSYRTSYMILSDWKGMYADNQFKNDYYGGLFQVPQGVYPFSTAPIAVANMDIPLLAARSDDTVSYTLDPGDEVVFVGCDAQEWLYVTELTRVSHQDMVKHGWIRLVQDEYNELSINGEAVYSSDAFRGLNFGG